MDDVKITPIPFKWKGETYDFARYDDVRIWQENGKQKCYLSKNGKPDETNGAVPCDNHAEAVEFQVQFHSLRPRLHYQGQQVDQHGIGMPQDP